MVRVIVVAAVLVTIMALAMHLATQDGAPPRPAGEAERSAAARAGSTMPDVERRLSRLEAKLAAERAERLHLEERLAALTAQLAARGPEVEPADGEQAAASAVSEAAEVAVAFADAASAEDGDDGRSPMERALTAAGLAADVAADIKRRHDAQAMTEMYLRDQAAREGWLDTPRFADEMAALAAQRTTVRDELADDDAYDRYLFALGESNRVRVDDVMLQSPAAQAGLQTGDVIVRYGDTRIFAPGELVAQTRDGTAGETVRIEVIRNGERLDVEVPRGPLGLRIAATQNAPEKG
jgi:membrane-associated protease RseP (regulator of RpoE activity)